MVIRHDVFCIVGLRNKKNDCNQHECVGSVVIPGSHTVYRLFHSSTLVAVGLSVDKRHGLQMADITIMLYANLTLNGLYNNSTSYRLEPCERWKLISFLKRPSADNFLQSSNGRQICLLSQANLPAVRAVQGDCERVKTVGFAKEWPDAVKRDRRVVLHGCARHWNWWKCEAYRAKLGGSWI